METTAKVRAAIVQRCAKVLGPDAVIPERLDQLPLAQRLALENADPVVAQVLSGQPLPASLELQCTAGTLPTSYDGPSLEQQAAAERAAAIAAVEQSMTNDLEQLRQRNAAMQQAREAGRQESMILAQAMQQAAARARFGVGA